MPTLIRVVHQQLVNRSILIDKVDKSQGNSEGYANKAKQKVYVPHSNPLDTTVKGYIDMVPTDEVLLSLDNGTLKGLADKGHVTNVAFSSALTATPVVSAVAFDTPSLVITGTTLASLSPDVTYVTLDDGSSVQILSQSSFASSVTGLVTLANELKTDYEAHRVDTTSHSVADTTNEVTSPDATDLASAITLLNELKTDYEAHRVDTTSHPVADATNSVAAADATDFPTAVILANELKADFNAHRTQATVHSANDTTNVVSSGSLGDVSSTQIIIPSSAFVGTPTTGWKVKVQANSKVSNTFTMT